MFIKLPINIQNSIQNKFCSLILKSTKTCLLKMIFETFTHPSNFNNFACVKATLNIFLQTPEAIPHFQDSIPKVDFIQSLLEKMPDPV